MRRIERESLPGTDLWTSEVLFLSGRNAALFDLFEFFLTHCQHHKSHKK